jgi:hypothetical protein
MSLSSLFGVANAILDRLGFYPSIEKDTQQFYEKSQQHGTKRKNYPNCPARIDLPLWDDNTNTLSHLTHS